jgi:hypothetical protein
MPWLFPQTTPLQNITKLALHSDSFFPMEFVDINDDVSNAASDHTVDDESDDNSDAEDHYERVASAWLGSYLPELASLEELVFVVDDTLTGILLDFDNVEFEDFRM